MTAAGASRPALPPGVEPAVDALLAGFDAALGPDVVGVYLFGSAVAGDFQPGVSDVDLLVVTADDVDDAALRRLAGMHASFASGFPDWADRVDVAYLSAAGLRGFKERESPIVVVSPGEGPLRRTRTLPGWATNWHQVREVGVALRGPPPASVVPAMSEADFLRAVRIHLAEMPGRTAAAQSEAFLVYAVFTACRGLHAAAGEGPATKTGAARWAWERYPEWRAAIEAALAHRRGERGEDRAARCIDKERAVALVSLAARSLARG